MNTWHMCSNWYTSDYTLSPMTLITSHTVAPVPVARMWQFASRQHPLKTVCQPSASGSKQMEITGHEIGTVGRVVHNLPVSLSGCTRPDIMQNSGTLSQQPRTFAMNSFPCFLKCTKLTFSSYSVTTVKEIHKMHIFILSQKTVAMVILTDGIALNCWEMIGVSMSWMLCWVRVTHD